MSERHPQVRGIARVAWIALAVVGLSCSSPASTSRACCWPAPPSGRPTSTSARRLSAIGILLGLAGALAAGRLLSAALFGISPSDPLALGATALAQATAALAACLIPAWRATRTDPIAALRQEERGPIHKPRVAVEINASGRVSERDAKSLHTLGDEAPIETRIIVGSERSERRLDSGVRVMPVRRFLDELWSDAIVQPGA